MRSIDNNQGLQLTSEVVRVGNLRGLNPFMWSHAISGLRVSELSWIVGHPDNVPEFLVGMGELSLPHTHTDIGSRNPQKGGLLIWLDWWVSEKRIWEISLSVLTMWWNSEKISSTSQKGFVTRHWTWWHLDLGPQISRTVRKKYSMF